MEDTINKFNNKVSLLLNKLHSKNKDDDNINTMLETYRIAKRAVPAEIIKMFGPYLWKYRAKICGTDNDGVPDVKYFLNGKFDDDIDTFKANKAMKAGKFVDKIPERSKLSKSYIIMDTIKATWFKFTEEEQKQIITYCIDLVSLYATYLSITKNTK